MPNNWIVGQRILWWALLEGGRGFRTALIRALCSTGNMHLKVLTMVCIFSNVRTGPSIPTIRFDALLETCLSSGSHNIRLPDPKSHVAPILHPESESACSLAFVFSTPRPARPCRRTLRAWFQNRKAQWRARSSGSQKAVAGSCWGLTIGMSSLFGLGDGGGAYKRTFVGK